MALLSNTTPTTTTTSLRPPTLQAPKLNTPQGSSSTSSLSPDEMPKITIGVCAMDKKAKSKQMTAIIDRLLSYNEFQVTLFGDDTILNKGVEDWPIVQVLLAWHSEKYPLHKAQQYVALRKPYCVNDVFQQNVLLDRRQVYLRLKENSIPVPNHIIVSRDSLTQGETDPPGFIETEDYVELDGARINKPFVEKPASGEDHNVHIYYPHSMGGGVKRLFRKVDNKSADYDPDHPGSVRRDGSFIYEEFLPTGGTDVKVYTVGPRYAHAEARKSPVVDGKVMRTADGKEVRFPVLLNPQEKETARMVCLAFGQRVCGFDLLRSERGKSYVCDVNGWSFVKNSHKYYDDAAGILRMIILSAIAPHRLLTASIAASCPLSASDPLRASPSGAALRAGSTPPPGVAGVEGSALRYSVSYDDVPVGRGSSLDIPGAAAAAEGSKYSDEELRCVLAVIRHGDRTPKQKMKMKVTQGPLLDLFHKYVDFKGKQAKLKSPNELQELLDVTRELLEQLEAKQKKAAKQANNTSSIDSNGGGGKSDIGCGPNSLPPSPIPAQIQQQQQQQQNKDADEDEDEMREKFRIMKTVLEQGGHFTGINRKVQLKPLKWAAAAEGQDGSGNNNNNNNYYYGTNEDGTGTGNGGGEGALSPSPSQNGKPRCTEALLILKHGGVLTHAGREQAESLGMLFREIMYPNQGPAGGGLLRLHSTYRHDFKIYSSDEGRVQSSAAAFTKGLLDLEGAALTPILVSLVKKDAGMLDAFGKGASEDIRRAKAELYQQMTWDRETGTSLQSEQSWRQQKVTPPASPVTSGTLGSGGGGGGALLSGSLSDTLTQVQQLNNNSSNSNSSSRRTTATPIGDGVSPSAFTAAIGPISSTTTTTIHTTAFDQIPRPVSAPAGTTAGLFSSSTSWGNVPRSIANNNNNNDGDGDGNNNYNNNTNNSNNMVNPSRTISIADTAVAYNQGQSLSAQSSTAALPYTPTWGKSKVDIYPMPPDPLALLRKLYGLLGELVDCLRQKCMEDSKREKEKAIAAANGGGSNGSVSGTSAGGSTSGGGSGKNFSALTQDPRDWMPPDEGQPCTGEKLLLMFDRWRKLLKAFYSKDKGLSKTTSIASTGSQGQSDTMYISNNMNATNAAAAAAVAAAGGSSSQHPQSPPPITMPQGTFDISKIPDIYDAAKYDMIHNFSLFDGDNQAYTIRQVYELSKELANTVIPNEYGLTQSGKLRIGSMICSHLLGKLLADLASMREESIATAGFQQQYSPDLTEAELRLDSLTLIQEEEELMMMREGDRQNSGGGGRRPTSSTPQSPTHKKGDSMDEEGSGGRGEKGGCDGKKKSNSGNKQWKKEKSLKKMSSTTTEDDNEQEDEGDTGEDNGETREGNEDEINGNEPDEDGDDAVLHRLCPTYAQDINSPLRHVRTRIYFTSESHMHSLINVLRYCHLGVDGDSGLLSSDGQEILKQVPELDYMTHIVFRMFESKTLPLSDPRRFRVEILFSPGAAYDPAAAMASKHVLPVAARVALHGGDDCGVALQKLERMSKPFATKFKRLKEPYALKTAPVPAHPSEIAEYIM